MQGKTVVITGATSGIGEVAAIRLAEQGARIVFTARDQKRADATMAKLRKANPAADHAVHMADLSTARGDEAGGARSWRASRRSTCWSTMPAPCSTRGRRPRTGWR